MIKSVDAGHATTTRAASRNWPEKALELITTLYGRAK